MTTSGDHNSKNLYGMLPSASANLAGLIMFSILWVYHAGTFYYRQWWFSTAIFIGCGLEVAGYVGRWKSSSNPDILNDFLVQIVCLTLAPAFIMGGIYFQLAKLAAITSESLSPLRPMLYSAIFISCDLVSIILQAIGGGMASSAVQSGKDTAPGTHVMVAGIAFQVVSMTGFLFFFFIFMFRVYKVQRTGREAEVFKPEYAHIRRSPFFKLFPYAITSCSIFIFIRCVYRVIELAQGWTGFLITHEAYFLVLDGLAVFLGVLSVSLVHPGFLFKNEKIPVQGLRKKKVKATTEDYGRTPSVNSKSEIPATTV